jgi:hypothetical protein
MASSINAGRFNNVKKQASWQVSTQKSSRRKELKNQSCQIIIPGKNQSFL